MSIGQMSTGQMSAGQMSVSQKYVGQMVFGEKTRRQIRLQLIFHLICILQQNLITNASAVKPFTLVILLQHCKLKGGGVNI